MLCLHLSFHHLLSFIFQEKIQAQINILKRKLTEKKSHFLNHWVNLQRVHEMDIVHYEMMVADCNISSIVTNSKNVRSYN